MKLFFVAALLASLAVAIIPSADHTFEQYEAENGKTYAPEERAMRRQLFEKELDVVLSHNALDKSWTLGINQFSDRTDEEKQALNGYHRGMGYQQVAAQKNVHRQHAPVETLPSTVDWRNTRPSIISPVKNQGICGSCWTFATSETVESHHALKYPGKLQALSEQQIASCPFNTNPKNCGGTGGCGGGTAEVGFASIIKAGGLASEWLYPYTSIGGTNYDCETSALAKMPKHANITDFKKLPSNEYAPLMSAVANLGPIAISVDASTWHNYESGVYDGCDQTKPVIDHAVQLVGYGTDAQHGPYWLIRNSWSPFWGDNGYLRIRRNPEVQCGIDPNPLIGTGCEGGLSSVKVCGTCGILFDSSFPIIG